MLPPIHYIKDRQELQKLLAAEKSKRSKVRARKTTLPQFPGVVFDSGVEADRAGELHLMQMAGWISGLRAHPRYELDSKVVMTLDFEYTDVATGRLVAEDVKGGFISRDFPVRRAWLQQLRPDLTVRVVRRKSVSGRAGSVWEEVK